MTETKEEREFAREFANSPEHDETSDGETKKEREFARDESSAGDEDHNDTFESDILAESRAMFQELAVQSKTKHKTFAAWFQQVMLDRTLTVKRQHRMNESYVPCTMKIWYLGRAFWIQMKSNNHFCQYISSCPLYRNFQIHGTIPLQLKSEETLKIYCPCVQ
jgi:hypothetical protein